MMVITKSNALEERLSAPGTRRWARPPVLAALTALALASIVLMAAGQHAVAALGFFCVALGAAGLQLHDMGGRPAQDHLAVGLAGERAVTSTLAALDRRYVLVNGLQFARPRGELDHLLLGPHGLLAVETKAHGGHVACLGGHWRRWVIREDGRLEDLPIGNPSAQLARALRLLEGLLAAWGVTCPSRGVVVFTHPHVELELQDPPLPVVRLEELPALVAGLPDDVLSAAEVELLAARFRDYDPDLA